MTPRFQPSYGAAYGEGEWDKVVKWGKDWWEEHGDEVTEKAIDVAGDALKGDGKKPAKKKKKPASNKEQPKAPAERSTTGRTLPAGSDTLAEWLEAKKAEKTKKMLAIGAGATAIVVAIFMLARK